MGALQLRSFASRRRNGWLDWAARVKEAIDRCRPALHAAERGLIGCWRAAAPAARHDTRETDR